VKLSKIAIGNLKRKKARSVFLITGFALSIATIVALMGITQAMREDVERKLDEFGANIIITPHSESLSLSYGGVDITETSFESAQLREKDSLLINTIEARGNIRIVAPKVLGTKKLNGRSYLIVGVDFPSEIRLKKWWALREDNARGHTDTHASKNVPIPSQKGILVGSATSDALGIKKGDTLSIDGAKYEVEGVLLENSSQDDIAIFMDIKEAQGILGKKGLSLIEVSALCSACPIEDIVAQISERLPHAKVSAVRQAMALKMQTVKDLSNFSMAVSFVMLFAGALIVFVSMMSSITERTKEIGVLRAIGFRKIHIVKVIQTEALVVSLLAGVVGSLSGIVVSILVGGLGGFNPIILGVSIFIAILIGLLSSLYPALKASRLEPIEAMRYI